jgi:hypothetical protein
MSNLVVREHPLVVPADSVLEDVRDWTNRFEIHSQTSDRVYIVAQHKTKRHWGCSCPGWRRFRNCKHLDALRLPNYCKPCEVSLMLR